MGRLGGGGTRGTADDVAEEERKAGCADGERRGRTGGGRGPAYIRDKAKAGVSGMRQITVRHTLASSAHGRLLGGHAKEAEHKHSPLPMVPPESASNTTHAGLVQSSFPLSTPLTLPRKSCKKTLHPRCCLTSQLPGNSILMCTTSRNKRTTPVCKTIRVPG